MRAYGKWAGTVAGPYKTRGFEGEPQNSTRPGTRLFANLHFFRLMLRFGCRMTMKRRPRVLLADDHTLLLEAFRNLLEPEFEIVGAVEDGRVLLSAAAKLNPDR